MQRFVSIVVFCFLSSGLFAQVKDSLAKPKTLRQWNLSSDYSEEKTIPVDTSFYLFHRTKIADKYSPVNATLGNYGLPFYQINFFDRVTDPDRFLSSYYLPFMHLPENAVFMNIQRPFTQLDWSFAGPRETAEQTFKVRHSQNVNRFLNFGLIYDIIFSLGQYKYQRDQAKTFTFYSSYTGPKYKLYFSVGINTLKAWENGGIKDKSRLAQLNTQDIEVNLGGLDNAKSLSKNKNLLLVQRYTIGTHVPSKADSTTQKKQGFLGLSGTFSHILILDNTSKSYKDDLPASGFYDKILITTTKTYDSVYVRNIKNTLRFDFATDETRKFSLGGGVGFRNELFKYYHVIPVPFTSYPTQSVWNNSNNVLIGKLYNNIGMKLRWTVLGELFLTGYRSGDFTLNGDITKTFDWKKGKAFWLLTGSVMNRQPSFWYEQWGGNHFEWNNNFSKEFRIDLGSDFSFPGRKAEIKFNYAIINHYTDFDTTALPSQHAGGLSVAALYLKKELKAWKFHLLNEALFQKSSNSEILDLPVVTLKLAGFFEHLFVFPSTGGKLNTQLGVDLTFHTLYHPYSYMPATGRFYRQETETIGNYPFMNLFLNIKLKRTRVFLMFDHVNSGFSGYDYFMIPAYPMNTRMLRYGFSWTFYN